MSELWDVDTHDKEPPFFGWLCIELTVYPPTFRLKTRVHSSNSSRPIIRSQSSNAKASHCSRGHAARLLQHQQ